MQMGTLGIKTALQSAAEVYGRKRGCRAPRQEDLAIRSGISCHRFSQIVSGAQACRDTDVARICWLLNHLYRPLSGSDLLDPDGTVKIDPRTGVGMVAEPDTGDHHSAEWTLKALTKVRVQWLERQMERAQGMLNAPHSVATVDELMTHLGPSLAAEGDSLAARCSPPEFVPGGGE